MPHRPLHPAATGPDGYTSVRSQPGIRTLDRQIHGQFQSVSAARRSPNLTEYRYLESPSPLLSGGTCPASIENHLTDWAIRCGGCIIAMPSELRGCTKCQRARSRVPDVTRPTCRGQAVGFHHSGIHERVRLTRIRMLAYRSPRSSARSRAANSGSRANHAYCSLNLLSGRAGVPHTVCPPRIVLPFRTPPCPPTRTSSSMVQ